MGETETVAVVAGIHRCADGHGLEVDRLGYNPQSHTENLLESDQEADA